MNRQRGTALVVVLSMLAMSLMLGISAMQSSQVDERLAGNYRAAVKAQMAAERTAAQAQKNLRDAGVKLTDWTWIGCDAGSDLTNGKHAHCVDFSEAAWEEETFSSFHTGGRYLYVLGDALDLPGEYYIYALGEAYAEGTKDAIATSLPVYVELVPDYFPALSHLSPLTVASRFFNFRPGDSEYLGISRRGEGNAGAAIAVPDERDVDAVMASIPSGGVGNYAADEDGNIVTEQIFDVFSEPEKLRMLVNMIKSHPDVSDRLGSAEAPRMTYIDGDFTMPKDVGVAGGLLIVNGSFRWNGNDNFEGLIIVLGQEFTYTGGGSGSVIGALLHAPVVVDHHSGEWSHGIAEADASEFDPRGGGSIIQHDVDVLNSVAQLIPTSAVSLFSAENGGLMERNGFSIGTWR
ncbi:hypothetical protein EKK97_20265 [Billgrantia tianxiuensis]|uniref:Type 4 fimbrial biogenesis protein PilX N-terminal domain-containing protein n=1 Tax=Billgrantia tianxiuensis TaxID=2497861 RepID=A0A6I6SRU2_9GAMM|nr:MULTISPECIES: hypothetical protein [Halomonas]MCE8033919.1 hypothetical protein [Halomonas sp. MCCC 1A11057]QHC51466.1 hypothetical protein EKK97_20265 [Halomonas tianxiuensis]